MKINFIWFLFFCLIACNQKKNKKIIDSEKETAGIKKNDLPGNQYNFAVPDKVWEMPPDLLEISGICFNKERKILCHQDQNGKIFVFNLKTSNIENNKLKANQMMEKAMKIEK